MECRRGSRRLLPPLGGRAWGALAGPSAWPRWAPLPRDQRLSPGEAGAGTMVSASGGVYNGIDDPTPQEPRGSTPARGRAFTKTWSQCPTRGPSELGMGRVYHGLPRPPEKRCLRCGRRAQRTAP